MFLDSVPLMNSEGSAVHLKLDLDVSYGTVMKTVKKKKAFRHRKLQDPPCWGINHNENSRTYFEDQVQSRALLLTEHPLLLSYKLPAS